MCGIFGFSGTRPDYETIKALAHGAARRGQDGFGFGWVEAADAGDEPRAFRSQSKLSSSLEELRRLDGARVAVGHARLATQGDSKDLRNLHPFAAGGSTLLVQNGNVYNFRQVAQQFGLKPASDCDSEVLALLVANQEHGNAGQRLARALSLVESPAFAVAVLHDGRLAVARRRLPLFMKFADGVCYFSSVRFSVGEHDAVSLVENEVVEVREDGDRAAGLNLAKHVIADCGLNTPEQSQSAWQQIRQPKGR